MSKIVGIDPGLKGAVAVLSNNTVEIYQGYTLNLGQRTTYDQSKMRELLVSIGPDIVYIERQHAFPGQGVVSMFSTGFGFGLWLGILTGLSIPYQMVSAKVWQVDFFAGQKHPKMKKQELKNLSYKVASQLYPKDAKKLVGPRGGALDGCSDALLIATYGKHKESK